MTREERDALKKKVLDFDETERRIEGLNHLLSRIAPGAKNGIYEICEYADEFGLTDDQRERLRAAAVPIFAESLERDIQKLQELKVN